MGSFLTGNGGGSVNQIPATTLRIQTSIDGRPIPFGYGRVRIPGNIVYTGPLITYPPSQNNNSLTGKGGVFGSGGTQNNAANSYTYAVSFVLALCEGPIAAEIPFYCWYNKGKIRFSYTTLAGATTGTEGEFGLAYVNGNFGQGPTVSLAYRGTAYMYSNPTNLGSTPDIPNLTFDISFAINSNGGLAYGALPTSMISDMLSNTTYGLGFPSARFDTNTLYTNYCLSYKFAFNALVAEQKAASEYLKEWLTASNSEMIFTGGLLKIIPYGDTASGTYTPPTVVPYSVSDVDYVMKSSNGDPVVVTCSRLEDKDNAVVVEYLAGESGNSEYNPATVTAKNAAAINTYGLKTKGTVSLHCITENATAKLAAELLLGRESILNHYEFTLTPNYILLDPMDLLPISDNVLGLVALPVRIKEITENDDYSLTILAEEYPQGAAWSPAVASQVKSGFGFDYAAAPGNVTTPMFIEPTYQFAGGLSLYIAVSGVDLANWGGCDCLVSTDGLNYSKIGTILGPSRFGVTTAILPRFPSVVQGNTIDNINTLSVDLSISQGSLPSSTQSDMISFSSALWVDGEIIAYQNSTPTATYAFNLTTLNREGFGTDSTILHASGVQICRLDDNLLKAEYTQDRIGSTVYFKFLSFNKFGARKQQISDVGAYSYTILGTAFTSQISNTLASQYNPSNSAGTVRFNLPTVQNFSAAYIGGTIYLDWDPVIDPRWPIHYQVRKGSTWDNGTIVGTYFHPHVPAPGDDTYWIKAVCYSPASAPGSIFYSASPVSVVVTSSLLPPGLSNVLASWDEFTLGFTGTLDTAITKPVSSLQTVPAGNPVLLLHMDP